MKKWLQKYGDKIQFACNYIGAMLGMAGFILWTCNSGYTAYNYDGIATAVEGEINAGLPAFAVVIGLAIGIPLAFKLIRRVAR